MQPARLHVKILGSRHIGFFCFILTLDFRTTLALLVGLVNFCKSMFCSIFRSKLNKMKGRTFLIQMIIFLMNTLPDKVRWTFLVQVVTLWTDKPAWHSSRKNVINTPSNLLCFYSSFVPVICLQYVANFNLIFLPLINKNKENENNNDNNEMSERLCAKWQNFKYV